MSAAEGGAAGGAHPDPWSAASHSGDLLRERLGAHRCAVVLGSGWAPVAEQLGDVLATEPAGAAGLATPGVPGHAATVRSVDVDGVPTLVLAGRVHLYEGHDVAAVCHSVRAAVSSGCSTVVLTNAAGALRPDLQVGRPVLVSDQLNLTGANPMVGPPPPGDPSARFVDLVDLYAADRRAAVQRAVPGTPEGVYAGLLGGSYETPAEIRMLSTLGADLVGMSTVLEAVAARHLGATVVGVSLVTNLAAGLQDRVAHSEVLEVAHSSTDALVEVLRAAVATA